MQSLFYLKSYESSNTDLRMIRKCADCLDVEVLERPNLARNTRYKTLLHYASDGGSAPSFSSNLCFISSTIFSPRADHSLRF
jgi:hypothetical protein